MTRLLSDRPLLRMTSELGKVMAAAKAREAAGERVLHLERGEPDFDTPPHVIEALDRAARAGETHYPDSRGTLSLRTTLVEKLRRENGIACEPDDIVMTLGGTHGLFITFQALLGPDNAPKYDDIQKNYRDQQSALDKDMRSRFEKAVADTMLILTPEQQAKYKEILARHRPPDRDGRGGPRGPGHDRDKDKPEIEHRRGNDASAASRPTPP